MDVANSTPSAPAPEQASNRLLCAYSPTWLSGPTPGYQGLCPSWDAPEADRASDREHSLV
jgi:hypothetical protein